MSPATPKPVGPAAAVAAPDPEFVAGRRLGGMRDAAAAFGRPVRTVQKWLYAGKFSKTRTGQLHWPSVLVEIGVKPELALPKAERGGQ